MGLFLVEICSLVWLIRAAKRTWQEVPHNLKLCCANLARLEWLCNETVRFTPPMGITNHYRGFWGGIDLHWPHPLNKTCFKNPYTHLNMQYVDTYTHTHAFFFSSIASTVLGGCEEAIAHFLFLPLLLPSSFFPVQGRKHQTILYW